MVCWAYSLTLQLTNYLSHEKSPWIPCPKCPTVIGRVHMFFNNSNVGPMQHRHLPSGSGLSFSLPICGGCGLGWMLARMSFYTPTPHKILVMTSWSEIVYGSDSWLTRKGLEDNFQPFWFKSDGFPHGLHLHT